MLPIYANRIGSACSDAFHEYMGEADAARLWWSMTRGWRPTPFLLQYSTWVILVKVAGTHDGTHALQATCKKGLIVVISVSTDDFSSRYPVYVA